MKYIVPKGYIAVDGTSLTVCEVDYEACWFKLMLVAHTQTKVVLPHRKIGEKVNIEVDVLAKYAETAALEGSGRSAALQAADSLAKPSDAPAVDNQGEIKAIRRTLHGAGLKVPLPTTDEAKTIKVAIAHTCWHEEMIGLMVDKCAATLVDRGVQPGNIVTAAAPGSYELPYLAKRLVEEDKSIDVVVCVGILLKGGTIHMEVIANAVTNELMGMQMVNGTPIIFGILTVLQIEQAVERAESALPSSWADSALTMALHKKRPRTVPYLSKM